MTRLIFAPPLPLNAFPYSSFTVNVRRLAIEELKQLVTQLVAQGTEIRNYIRHPSTVRLLNEVLGLDLQPSASLYQYQPGDIIVIVGLKKPVRGQEVEVSIEDLDIAMISIAEVKS